MVRMAQFISAAIIIGRIQVFISAAIIIGRIQVFISAAIIIGRIQVFKKEIYLGKKGFCCYCSFPSVQTSHKLA